MNRLRKELISGVPPVITEIPDSAIALMYPQLQIGCMFSNRRVQVNDGSQEPIGTRPVSGLALAIDKIVGSKLAAYGFNYEVTVTFDQGDLRNLFKTRF